MTCAVSFLGLLIPLNVFFFLRTISWESIFYNIVLTESCDVHRPGTARLVNKVRRGFKIGIHCAAKRWGICKFISSISCDLLAERTRFALFRNYYITVKDDLKASRREIVFRWESLS